jgi:TolB-like protein
MSDSTKAVFLSYAREDTAAAQRIAEALRSHGVEVWFDQNELRGGDAWDSKIRRQIKECTLFMPVVSARTEERHEGYFRLEWKLAVDRSHLMLEGVPFLAPVVIDDTRDSDAAVPAEFLRVQWTRLPGALPTPQFVEQVKRLLDAPRRLTIGGEADGPRISVPVRNLTQRKSGLPGWVVVAGAAAIVAVAVALGLARKAEQPASAPPPVKPAEAAPVPGAIPVKSIAVLPFDNFSPDKENEFFTDGIHEEVITALAKIHDLKVISRTSVMGYRPGERNLKKIAIELGVANVLEGSVRREGNQVRVTAQLIDARTDEHLWAEAYTRDLTNVFTIQSELASAITSALKATLSPEEKSLIGRRPTQNQEAYDLYLRARALGNALGYVSSRESLDEVVSLYEQAVAKDPGFTLAYVELVRWHGTLYWFGHLDPTPARRARAKAALDAALRLDPDLPETRLALGVYSYFCENDWARSLAELTAAEIRLPNDSDILYAIARAQRRLGRLREALISYRRALALNSRDLTCMLDQVETLSYMRRFSEVRELGERYLVLFPDDPDLFRTVAKARFELDRDRTAFVRTLAGYRGGMSNFEGVLNGYYGAMASGDLQAVDRVLADSRLSYIPSPIRVINDPVALYRGLDAFLRGRPDEARTFANEALAYYRSGQWTHRQEPVAMIGTALALALAGRGDEAMKLANDAFAVQSSRDAFSVTSLRPKVAQIYLMLGRREEALALLREMMTGPCDIGPEEVRIDPFWSRLKSDPRFEQILASAKPL